MEADGVQVLLHPLAAGRSAGIVVEPTEDLRRLQQKLIDAVAPYTEKSGTAAAFMSTEDGHDIQDFLIDYVANFVMIAAGRKFNPHVTIGVATEATLNEMLSGAVRGVHLLACGGVGLPAWHFWHGPEGAEGFNFGALTNRS